MKDNIDLTENRDFRNKAKNIYGGASSIISVSNGFKRPLQDVLDIDRFGCFKDDYYLYEDAGAVIQGDKEIRLSKLMSGEFCMGNYCDCCGKELFPYTNDCLCKKCGEHLDFPELTFVNFR